MSLNKPLESISEADLQALVSDGVPEGKVIEYKDSLPDDSHDDKKEFLADVSSFSNAAGGHLLFGIEEDAGVPVQICGLQDIDPDADILRLENMLRDNIEPRIPGLSMRAIQTSSGSVVVVRVPRSWAQPHVVKLQRHWRFYSRNSAGKYPLDVSELRGQFLLSETRAERVREFRAERLGKIVSDETPVTLIEGAKTVFHIIPFGAFDPVLADVAVLEKDVLHFSPIDTGSIDGWRYNLDGLVTYAFAHDPSSACSYLQIFRNGCIEAVEASMMHVLEGKPPVISSGPYEGKLLSALRRFLSIQERLGVEPPLFVMVSLLGVSGYLVKPARPIDPIDPSWWTDHAKPIDRDALVLPEIVINAFELNPAEVMRPIFDIIWNASGWSRSLNYDDQGNWLKKQA
jgi:hypothetical protein